MWLESIPKSPDHSETCPTCGSCVQRRSYGEMYAGSFILDGERVEIRKQPAEGFIDPIVLDPLTQYFDGGLYRVWPAERYPSRGGKKLHRDVWQSAFGPVPAGCHIHHRDRNPNNCQLSNLECMPAAAHLSHTWTESRGAKAKGDHFSHFARERATEWHQSEEGRLWHKRHAQRSQSWTKWKREPRPCLECGKEIMAIVRAGGHQQKFCGNNCKATHYRKRKASGDNG